MVSEFMLQQTPVARVLPVFESWMTHAGRRPARWPTAPSGEAVRAWGRLGYPRRALRLHAAAHGDRGAARRRGAAVVRRPDRAAGRRRLHRQRDRVVRLRRQPRRAGHQRAPGASRGPSAAWSSPPPSVTKAERELAESLVPDEQPADLGGGGDGARRPGLHGRATRAAPPARSATGAPGTWPAGRRTTDRRAAARPGPAPTGGPRPADGRAARGRGQRGPSAGSTQAWAEPVQRDRALESLLADGLVVVDRDGRYALPG